MRRFGPDPKTDSCLRAQCQPGRDAAPEDARVGANIVGMFDGQGQLAKEMKFTTSIMPMRGLRAMAKRDNSQGQPDAARLDRARAFGREMLEWKLITPDAGTPPGRGSE